MIALPENQRQKLLEVLEESIEFVSKTSNETSSTDHEYADYDLWYKLECVKQELFGTEKSKKLEDFEKNGPPVKKSMVTLHYTDQVSDIYRRITIGKH